MRRASLALAFLSIAALAGCGVGDAGRWMVTASLRSAYGCSLMISSDQAAVERGELAQRPEPLRVNDPSIVAARSSATTPERVVLARAIDREPEVEIASLPISRDLTSIRQPGTRRVRSVVRMAVLPRAGVRRVQATVPEPPAVPYQFTICTGKKG